MNYSFIRLALLVLIISFTNSVSAQSVVEKYGRLQVYGSHVCAANGTQITLGGMSFFWSNWASQYYNATTVNYLVDEFKVSIIRAAHGVPENEGEQGSWASIEAVVDAAIARGIYVIIDWHTEGDAWPHHARAVAFFSHMAQKYGNTPNVIYEPWNEPTGQSASSIKDFCQSIANTIRQYDPDNLIICGSGTWSQYPQSYTINDSNAAYTFHGYFDDPSNGAAHRQQFYNNVTQAMNQGNAVFVTEFGANYGSTGGSDEIINECQSRKISMCAWSVNDKPEPWSIFTSGMSGLTDIGNFYRDKMRNWPSAQDGGCSDAIAVVIGSSTKIEAENYCEMSGVKAENCSEGGQNIGWIDSGDWMAFKVNIPSSGIYTIKYRVASLNGGGSLKLEKKGGTNTYGTLDIGSTGDWQNWTTISHQVELPAGEQDLAIAATGGGWNLNWFEISGTVTTNYTLTTSTIGTGSGSITLNPAGGSYATGTQVIATANASSGSNFVSWSGDASGTSASVIITMNGNKSIVAEFAGGTGPEIHIEAEDYDVMSGIQTENCSEGTLNVGWIDAGDWMAYHDINIPTSGTYTVEYRVASLNGGGSIKLEQNNGATLLGQISIPKTDGWQNWTTISHTVNLNAGVQNFGLAAASGGFNINWIKFKSGTKSAVAGPKIDENKSAVFEEYFSIFPNPVYSELKIRGIANANSVVVYNLSGKELIINEVDGENEILINVEALNEGIYFLKVFQAGSVYSTKFVKN